MITELQQNTTTETTEKLQLVDGTFTVSEAARIINALLDSKISFHKLHRLSLSEGQQNADTAKTDQRIRELTNEKNVAKRLFEQAQKEGFNISVSGILEISFTK